jgi:GxxExxY protein
MKMRLESNLPDDLETLVRNVIGAAIEVHRHLGPGFLETIYEQALCYELSTRGITFARQKEIVVPYKNISISGQRLDIVVEGQVIVELKTVEQLLPLHEAQLLSYLKSTGIRVGLLINFNVKQLKTGMKRMVM